MADKKTSLIEDINKTTKEIAKETKTFGPKLPSRNEASEQTDIMIEATSEINTAIIGFFAHLIFGQSNKRKFSDLNSLIGKSSEDTIFGNVADLAKRIGAKKGTNAILFGKDIADGIAKSQKYTKKLENSIKNGIRESFTDLAIIDALSSINSSLTKRSSKDIMHEVIVKLQATRNLDSLVSILKQLNETTINAKTYNTLNDLNKLTSKKGPLYKLLKNVENLDIDAQKIIQRSKAMGSIRNIIDAVTNSASVSIKDVMRFKNSIFWIRHFIIAGLIDTINEMANIHEVTEKKIKSIEAGIQNFLAVIEAFDKTTNFGFWKSIRIRFNLYTLSNIISNSLREVLTTLAETLNENILSENQINNKMAILNDFVNSLSIIADKEKLDLTDAGKQLDTLNSLIDNQLREFMELVKEFESKDESDKILAIENNINNVLLLSAIIPQWKQLTAMISKTNLLIGFAREIESLAKAINRIPKNTLPKNQLSDLSNVHINGLIAIGQLTTTTDFKRYSEDVKKKLVPYVKDIRDLFNEIEKFKKLNIDFDKLKQINAYLTKFNELPVDKLPKQADILRLLDIERIINSFAKNFDADSFAVNEHMDQLIDNLKIFVIAMSSKGLIGEHIKDIVDLTKDDLLKLDNIISYLDKLSEVTKKLTVVEKLTAGMPSDPKDSGLVKFATALSVAVDKINSLDLQEANIERLNKSINTLAKFVIAGTGILLFGALMMMVIPIANVALFVIVLGAFVFAMTRIFKGMDKQIELSIEGAKAFSILLAVSAATLLFASFVVENIPIGDLIQFAAIEAIFIFTLSFAYRTFAKQSELAYEGAVAFSVLLIVSSASLILGSLLYRYVNWEDATGFILATTAFITGVALAYILPQKIQLFTSALNGISEFSILMITSGAVTVAGSLLFRYINWDDAFSFVTMTAVFIGAMILALAWPKLLGGGFKLLGMIPGAPAFLSKIGRGLSAIDPLNEAKKGLFDFSMLVIAAGMTLAIGSHIAKSIPFESLFKFAASLSAFMFMMLAPLLLLKGKIEMGEHVGKQFAKIIVVSAATMIIGGTLFTVFPQLESGVWKFALMHGLYIAAICTSMWIFNKANPDKMMSQATKLMLLTVVSAGVLLVGGLFMEKYPNSKINIPIFTGCLIFYILGMALALRLMPKAGQLLQGVIAIGLLVLITGLAALAMRKVGELSKQVTWGSLLKGIAQLAVGLLTLGGAYWLFGYLFFLDGGIGLGLATVALVIINGLTLLTAFTMKYISKNQAYFDTKNINKFKQAITAFGGLGKEMVKQFGGWMALKLPFISAAVVTLSFALSSIARTIAEYANLKIPVYKGTEVVGYHYLAGPDFDNAAKNVKTIITTLGGAVIETYKNPKNKEIFETNFFGTSTFAKVTKSLKTLGPMISSIATAVRDYAELKVPIYKGTEVVGYRHLGPNDFTNAAEHVKEVITTLGGAVIDAYNNAPDKEIFETNFFGKSKFAKVTKSFKTLGPMLTSIATAVKDYADLKVPVYDKDGTKIVSYRHLDKPDFDNAALHVGEIVSTLGGAIVTTFGEHKDWFDDGENSAFRNVVRGCAEMGTMISNIAKGVQMYAEAKMPIGYDKNGKPIGFIPFGPTTYKKAGKSIQSIIETIGVAIDRTFHKHKDWFQNKPLKKKGGFLGLMSVEEADPSDPPFIKAIKGISMMGFVIGSIAQGVQMFASMRVPSAFDANGKPTKFEILGPEKRKEAANNISEVLTILGKAFSETYTNNMLLFNNPLLPKIMDSFTKMGSVISSITSSIEKYSKMDVRSIDDLTQKLGNLNKTIKQLVSIVEYSESTGAEGYNIIMQGLDGITTKIAQIPKEDDFKNNVNQLERYVNAVNRIDLIKVMGLNSLAMTLNVLATKMGNLDKLTETLSTSIASVLDKLTKELKSAEKTIKDADILQKRRHDLIQKATKEVKSIMDQKMLVEIKQVQDETPLDSPGGSPGAADTPSNDSSQTPQNSTETASAGGNQDKAQESSDKSKKSATVTTSSKNDSNGGNASKNTNYSNSNKQTLTPEQIKSAIIGALETAHSRRYI